jgi:hypothetical protein
MTSRQQRLQQQQRLVLQQQRPKKPETNPSDPFEEKWKKLMDGLDQSDNRIAFYDAVESSAPIQSAVNDQRAGLLNKRKRKLIELAQNSSDAAIVEACVGYLRIYFGSERKIISWLCKRRLHWRVSGLGLRIDEWLERYRRPNTKKNARLTSSVNARLPKTELTIFDKSTRTTIKNLK